MNVVFRADASSRIGTGHIVRCLALGDFLKAQGAQITFLCRPYPGHMAESIVAGGHAVAWLPPSRWDGASDEKNYALWLGDSWQEDAKACAALLTSMHADWLVADHYGVDYQWESALRSHAKKMLVIDDLANRAHHCDILLDSNDYSNRDQSPYASLANGVHLLGPAYALLREEFARYRLVAPPRKNGLKKLLIFFGGSDPENLTEQVASAVFASGLCFQEINIVVGSGYAFPERLRTLCLAQDNVKFHVQTKDMALLMATSDLMIGAPGGASWERCCLGLPSILIAFAENQHNVGHTLANRRSAIYLGAYSETSIERVMSVLTRLSERPGMLYKISTRAATLVDGLGVSRVAAAIQDTSQC